MKALRSTVAMVAVVAAMLTTSVIPAQADAVNTCVASLTDVVLDTGADDGLSFPGVAGNTPVHGTATGFGPFVCTGTGATASVHVHGNSLNNGHGGYCGNSTGSGTVSDGTPTHAYDYTSAGTFLVLTGGATGVVEAVAHPHAPGDTSPHSPNSCAGGTAKHFQVTGQVVLT